MSEKHLHIISFTIPYPPNYGGVIDVYYKLKALYKKGIKIHLHCYEYDRKVSDQLKVYCTSVNYYPRKTGFKSTLSFKPYIVSSRRSNTLLQNLLKDDYPILFEGLHSCYFLDDPSIENRKKIYRESNIEHHYYYNLFKAEKRLTTKAYYLLASIKLRTYEKVLSNADLMLVVSKEDTAYLKKKFKEDRIHYLPSFHANEDIQSKNGKGDFVLYHGNLSVAENCKAAEFLINQVFNDLNIKFVIAGLNPPGFLKKLIDSRNNIELIENPSDETMFNLIRKAHINILITFQATGLKLKLLNTLYNGRFTLVNRDMLYGTELDALCVVANSADDLKKEIHRLFKTAYDTPLNDKKARILSSTYNNDVNADRLIELIFTDNW